MAKQTGVVARLNQKPTKTGGTAYSVLIDEVWYGAGFEAPKYQQGDNIEFNVPEGKWKNLADVVVLTSAPAAATPQQATTAAPANGGGYNNTQVSIVAQSALKAAIDFTNVLLTHDLITSVLGKTANKKVEIVEEIVRKYQRQFFDDNQLATSDLDAWHSGDEEAPGPADGEDFDG